MLVRDLQRVIGDEARAQYRERLGGDPDVVVACVGGGSNAIGMFTAFVGAPGVRLIGVEAGGRGSGLGEHCSSLTQGQPGILHGALSYLLQDADGQVAETHSISAGLDYPGVGPEHAYLQDAGLADYVAATDEEALDGLPGAREDRGHPPGARAVARDRVAAHATARRRARGCSCASRVAATRTSTRCAPRLGIDGMGLTSRRRCGLGATPGAARSSRT